MNRQPTRSSKARDKVNSVECCVNERHLIQRKFKSGRNYIYKRVMGNLPRSTELVVHSQIKNGECMIDGNLLEQIKKHSQGIFDEIPKADV
ncbi:hypothetical protein GJ496_001761 [Pomphorhynchus laevis]|nr:hypothetical protein GJ496_001761 [Pomphorhynchus laevis]